MKNLAAKAQSLPIYHFSSDYDNDRLMIIYLPIKNDSHQLSGSWQGCVCIVCDSQRTIQN